MARLDSILRVLVGLALVLALSPLRHTRAQAPSAMPLEPGLTLLKDIRPGPDGQQHFLAIAYGNRVFFAADDGVHGSEPWITDGTPTGTYIIMDLVPGSDGSVSEYSAAGVWGGRVYFSHSGDLWSTDGTAAGTFQVHSGASAIYNLTVGTSGILFDHKFYKCLPDPFHCTTPTQGVSISWSGGAAQNTVQLMEWSTPYNPPYAFIEYNGAAYVIREDDILYESVPMQTDALWKIDLATREPVLFDASTVPHEYLGLSILAVANNLLFFQKATPETGSELWQTDGTTEGTRLVADLTPGPASTLIENYLVTGQSLYFTSGGRLYRTDGHSTGIIPLAGGSGIVIESLDQVNGVVYFSLGLPGGGDYEPVRVPWRSGATADGTPEGTWPLCPTCLHSNAGSFTGIPGKILYGATDGSGTRLWVTDGTDGGTHRFAAPISPAGGLLTLNTYVFFIGADGDYGFEPWVYHPVEGSLITQNDTAAVEEVKSVTIDVISNDSQTHGIPISLAGFDPRSRYGGFISRDDRGTPADLTDDRLTYLPALYFDSPDEFTYWIEDGTGTVQAARVTVTVAHADPTLTLLPCISR